MPMILALLIVAFAGTPAQAKTVYKSTDQKIHMLELFSTQSCSSCPPAQRWVSQLISSDQLWKTFIPVVFHVDYWDYLGWKDPYSSPIYSQRQRDYVAEWFKTPAYTPMFVLDGEVTRANLVKDPISSPGEKVGILTAVKGDKAGHYKVHFNPRQNFDNPLVLYYSVLGSGISTKVKAGENDGLTLKHDFLSLKMDKVKMKKTKDGYSAEVRDDFDNLKSAPRKHVVFWVSQDISKKPIQMVGGPI